MKYSITTKCKSTNARLGELNFSNEITVATPVFMPVGTRASVKAISQSDLQEMGYDLILGNTYHLHLRPGDELISEMGGLHKFMSYHGKLLTESGGFQVFSLAKLRKFTDDGVSFRSHIDGSLIHFTPEKVLDIQKNLGSDIMMVLDDCPPYPADKKRLEGSMQRTFSWAKRAEKYYNANFDKNKQSCFGIIQGGLHKDLRKRSVEEIASLDFTSYAIGGLSVGEPRDLFGEILHYTAPLLPNEKPRYLMGVGTIPDILEGVAAGIDMFDCVLPTRNARRAQVFTSRGKLNLKNLKHAKSSEAIDPECSCKVCQTYSLSYIRHLFHVNEILALSLASYHNLYFLKHFMIELRKSIKDEIFPKFFKYWKNLYIN